MWLTGVFGIATKFSEALLAVRCRVKDENAMMTGGPMQVSKRALGVQANSISEMMQTTISIPTWITGVVLTLSTAVVVWGGSRSIAPGSLPCRESGPDRSMMQPD
jgi:AGCS family alanine or glycine:cation symporter